MRWSARWDVCLGRWTFQGGRAAGVRVGSSAAASLSVRVNHGIPKLPRHLRLHVRRRGLCLGRRARCSSATHDRLGVRR